MGQRGVTVNACAGPECARPDPSRDVARAKGLLGEPAPLHGIVVIRCHMGLHPTNAQFEGNGMNLAPQPSASAPNALAVATRRVRNSLDVLGARVGRLFNRRGDKASATSEGLLDLAGALLSLRGKASGPSLASTFFDLYEASDLFARETFLSQLHAQFGRDRDSIDRAIAVWKERRDEAAAALLNEATESPLHQLIRILPTPQSTHHQDHGHCKTQHHSNTSQHLTSLSVPWSATYCANNDRTEMSSSMSSQ
jgi:hypothetical protein